VVGGQEVARNVQQGGLVEQRMHRRAELPGTGPSSEQGHALTQGAEVHRPARGQAIALVQRCLDIHGDIVQQAGLK